MSSGEVPEHARTSAPTGRVLNVLEAVAGAPERVWTIGDLARAASVNKSTCIGIVNVLHRRGYVTRSDDGITIAGGFAQLSKVAEGDDFLMRSARPRLEALVARRRATLMLTTFHADGMRIVDVIGRPFEGLPVQPGTTIPWVTTGLAHQGYTAWMTDATGGVSVDSAYAIPIADSADFVRRARRDGYCALYAGPTMLRMFVVLASLHSADVSAEVRQQAHALSLDLAVRPGYSSPASVDPEATLLVFSPIFGPGPSLRAVLVALEAPDARAAGDDENALIRHTLAAAEALTAELGGHDPWRVVDADGSS